MAKCIKHYADGRVKRVSNKKAAEMVESGYWKYCPKHEYKRKKK